MRSKRIKGVGLCAAFALLAPVAFAQTTGRIEGRVTGDGGEALPGVGVRISSPALQGERVAVTDAGGRFRFPGVPVGLYDLQASLAGFGMIEQQNVDVGLSRTVSLLLELSGAFPDEVTISRIAPIVDTTSTTAGANFGHELISDLPTSRTFTGLAFAAPGVVGGGLGDSPSIGGASAAENRYLIDGLDTTDPAFGTVGTRLPVELVREVEIKTGGYQARYGGALGGVVNVVTRSGGNRLEGGVFGYFSDESLQEETPAVPQVGRDLGYEEYDLGAALGGRIVEDRLWYFAAVDASHRNDFVSTRGGLIEDTEELDRIFYSAKLTFRLDPGHQLAGSAFGDPSEGNDTVQNAYGRLGTELEEGAHSYALSYNGTLTSRLFAEASIGRYDEEVVAVPYDPSVPRYDVRSGRPEVEHLFASGQLGGCGSTGAFLPFTTAFSASPTCLGSTFQVDDGDRSREELRGAATWFARAGAVAHQVELGAVVCQMDYTDDASYPGRDLSPFFDSNGSLVDETGLRGQRWLLGLALPDGTPYALLLEVEQESAGQTREQAVFLQDSIRVGDHLTLNLGLRADRFESHGSGADFTDSGLRRFLDFDFGDMVAPRLGFTWDVAQNGRSKLYGHYGHFYESVPLDINVRAFGDEVLNVYSFLYPEDGAGNPVLPTAGNPGTHVDSAALGVATGVSRDLEAMYTEEVLAGFEYEVMPNVAIGVKGTLRTIHDVIEDVSVDGGRTYFVTNPGGSFTHNPVTGERLVDDRGDAITVSFPRPVRDYESLELTLDRRFSKNWQLSGSAVYAKNEGDYGGLFRQDNGQLDPNITSLYDLPDLLEGAFGLLPNDREYQLKAYGSYLWPFRLTTGFYAQYLDGTPISKLGAHPIYGPDERFVTPRGSAGRTPDVWNVDLHLQYPIRLGGGNDLKLIVDVFNVSDEQEAVTVDQTWTHAPARSGLLNDEQTNPLWGTPTSYQAPRTIRLGAKLSF